MCAIVKSQNKGHNLNILNICCYIGYLREECLIKTDAQTAYSTESLQDIWHPGLLSRRYDSLKLTARLVV